MVNMYRIFYKDLLWQYAKTLGQPVWSHWWFQIPSSVKLNWCSTMVCSQFHIFHFYISPIPHVRAYQFILNRATEVRRVPQFYVAISKGNHTAALNYGNQLEQCLAADHVWLYYNGLTPNPNKIRRCRSFSASVVINPFESIYIQSWILQNKKYLNTI